MPSDISLDHTLHHTLDHTLDYTLHYTLDYTLDYTQRYKKATCNEERECCAQTSRGARPEKVFGGRLYDGYPILELVLFRVQG